MNGSCEIEFFPKTHLGIILYHATVDTSKRNFLCFRQWVDAGKLCGGEISGTKEQENSEIAEQVYMSLAI